MMPRPVTAQHLAGPPAGEAGVDTASRPVGMLMCQLPAKELDPDHHSPGQCGCSLAGLVRLVSHVGNTTSS